MRNQFIFNDIKKDIITQYGEDAGTKIWQRAEDKYALLRKTYGRQISGDGKYIINVAAIYISLKEYDEDNALDFLIGCGKRLGEKFKNICHNVTSVPGVPEMLWKNMPSIMRKMGGASHGYASEFINTDDVVGVNILSCPIYSGAVKMGVPEAALIICAMDKEYMEGFNNIIYTRTMSLAKGDVCCDYRMSYIGGALDPKMNFRDYKPLIKHIEEKYGVDSAKQVIKEAGCNYEKFSDTIKKESNVILKMHITKIAESSAMYLALKRYYPKQALNWTKNIMRRNYYLLKPAKAERTYRKYFTMFGCEELADIYSDIS